MSIQLVVALLSAVSSPQGSGSNPGAASLPFKLEKHVLDNGLGFVLVPTNTKGLVAYYSLVRVGSRDEVEPGVTGFAHFFEHMMFRGTAAYPPEAVQAILQQAGADQNGFTTDDFTCYTYLGSAAFLEEWTKYEADRFQNLEYTEEVFKTEAGAVLGEYNKSTSQPDLPLEEKLREAVFGRHTYAHTTLGYAADIRDMPNKYEYSKKFFQRFYTPDNTTVIVVGDFDPSAFMAMAKTHYSPWARKRAKTLTQVPPKQTKPIELRVPFKEKTLPRFSLSWRTPATSYGSKDTAVYNVLYELLFGKISPVYGDLVLDRQLVDDFSNWNWDHRDPYLFHVVATVKDEKHVPEVEKRVETAIAELAKGKLDDKILSDVKANVRYSMLLGFDSPEKIASALAFTIGPTGDTDGLQKLLRSIEAVKASDVQSFVKRFLTRSNRSQLTLVSEGGAS